MKKLNVFLSSSMTGELDVERSVIKTLFRSDSTLRDFFDLYVIEEHASPMPIEDAFIAEVRRSDVVIFLFDKELREAVEKEFTTAVAANKKPFVFIKTRTDPRDAALAEFISAEAYKFHSGAFFSTNELLDRIKTALINDIVNQYTSKDLSNGNEDRFEKKDVIAVPGISLREGASVFAPYEITEYSQYPEIVSLSVSQLKLLSHYFSENNWDFKRALLFLEVAIQREPENWELFHNKAQLLSQIGHDDQAALFYKKVLLLNPNSHPTHFNLGIYYKNKGYDEAAIEHFRKALEIYPKKHTVLSHLVNLCIKRKEYPEALAYARRAIEIAADSLEIANVAITEALNSNIDAAWEMLGRLDREDELYFRTKALIFEVEEEIKKALDSISIYIERFGGDYWAGIKKAYYLIELSLYEELECWICKMECSYAFHAGDYNDLGYRIDKKGEKTELAISLYEKAVKLDPLILVAWKNLQVAFGNLNRFEEGIEASEQALIYFPHDPDIVGNMSRFLVSAGEYNRWNQFIIEVYVNQLGSSISEEQKEVLIGEMKKSDGFIDLQETIRKLSDLS